MKFCSKCDNYLILRIKESTSGVKLEYHCKKCGNTSDKVDTSKPIYSKNFNSQELQSQIGRHTKFIIDDPTNPRVNNLTCPQEDCPSHKTGDNEVVYISINDADMKFMYVCVKCKNTWTNN